MGRGRPMSRGRFIADLPTALGVTPIAGIVLKPTDTTTTVCPWSGRTWTADTTMALKKQGFGTVRTMVAGSSNYFETPDANDLSFGNGAADSPFTIIHYGKPSSTAGNHGLLSKSDLSTLQEWRLHIAGTGVITLALTDQSAAAQPLRVSDAGAPVDSWHSYACTYSAATGGATAANDVTLLVDGVAVASTPTNNASYVALENLTNPANAGASGVHSAQFYDGSYGCVLLCAGALSAAVLLRTHALMRGYFGG